VNIFCTDECPIQSAYDLDDKRVIKMIVETGQLLSTSVSFFISNELYEEKKDLLYKSCFINHPCNIWARESYSNFLWLYIHGLTLLQIYEKTYNKKHKSGKLYEAISSLIEKNQKITEYPISFCDCTEYKDRIDLSVHERYRKFMILKWSERDKTPPTWKKRNKPLWYKEMNYD
jgi:hypothetical protein